jgi:two-component system KDP operon response regulator KdpE
MAVQPNLNPSAPSDNRKVVLVAEDDPFISRMYQIKLESAGLRVVVKANGRDAYEAIKTSAPNLLLLDINMPELTGLELLGALAGDNFDFSTMPVMVLTNSSNPDDKKTAQSYGADYLVKADYTPREVLDMIQQKLGIAPADKTAA